MRLYPVDLSLNIKRVGPQVSTMLRGALAADRFEGTGQESLTARNEYRSGSFGPLAGNTHRPSATCSRQGSNR